MPEEERQKREAEKADKRKARKNNGAKRDMHYEMEEEEHVVYPDDPDFDINKGTFIRFKQFRKLLLSNPQLF